MSRTWARDRVRERVFEKYRDRDTETKQENSKTIVKKARDRNKDREMETEILRQSKKTVRQVSTKQRRETES